MKPVDLKTWMDRNDKTVTDVAAFTKISTRTVERFLKGKHDPRPVIVEAFRRMMATPVRGKPDAA